MSSSTAAHSRASRVWRSGLALLAALIVVVPIMTSPPQPALAADQTRFDPANLISDYAFFNGAAMTEQEIQTFLDGKSNGCLNSNCLAIYRQSTSTREASARCGRFEGGANDSAARILFKVQVACGVSAKALLVTLQKEQGLVTAKAPGPAAIKTAMGYGCPDTAVCDSQFFGFANQLYSAANQFKRYAQYPTSFRHSTSKSTNVYYHPNSFLRNPPTCGSVSILPRNQATAGLYNYTPYTPNAAAMTNLYGTGDACSSYGNRNFWRFYWDWFGSPTTLVPAGVRTSTIAGVDRYVTAATISQRAYPQAFASGTGAVYVAAGTAFADGLSAAPVAASQSAPLLLTARDHVPESTQAEIRRLRPQRVVMLGGPLVLGPRVERQLRALAPTFERVAGIDRFETARLLARSAFSAGSATAYIATGENFPDALAASAAAGAQRAPVLLVRSSDTTVPAELAALLQELRVTRVVVMGSAPVITPALEAALRTVPGVTRVDRFGGATRYDTALALNRSEFPRATRAFIASGTSFADAMSAAAVAGKVGAPIVLSNGTCTIPGALQHLVDAGITDVSVLGGPIVMRSTVREYFSCG